MCVRTMLNSDRYLIWRYRCSQTTLVLLLVYLFIGFLSERFAHAAQSQEFTNGLFRGELDSLRREVGEIKGMAAAVLVGIVVSIAVQMVNLRQSRQQARRRRATDNEGEGERL